MGSLTKLWIHAVWSTKYRQQLIQPDIEQRIFDVLKDQFSKKGCSVRIINGAPDHVHSLFRMSKTTSIADLIKYVKGGSSYQINSWSVFPRRFEWQIGYAAYSVNPDELDGVYRYILNQKFYHRAKTNSGFNPQVGV